MEADGDILGTRHTAAILRYVLRNDGCILRDMREDVTGNCSTVLAVCSKLRDSGLLETEDVRSRPDTGRRSTVYHLTPKGRRAAMLLDAASSVIEEDGRIDPDELDAFLDSVFRRRSPSQSGDRPRTQIEELENIAVDISTSRMSFSDRCCPHPIRSCEIQLGFNSELRFTVFGES